MKFYMNSFTWNFYILQITLSIFIINSKTKHKNTLIPSSVNAHDVTSNYEEI